MTLCLIAPPLDGRPTGGTLYNSRALSSLRSLGVSACRCGIRQLPSDATSYLLDSLYLPHVLRLRREGVRPLWLLLHYLPSLVGQGNPVLERAALLAADGVIVTSPTMRAHLRAKLPETMPIACVEPGADPEPHAWPMLATPPRAVMLSHLVPNKGVEALLDALASCVRRDDHFELRVVGSMQADQESAARCRALVSDAALRQVKLLGELAPDRARAELCGGDLFVSASRFEAYGMALSEARAAGVPILAMHGGHTAAHVDAHAGGELLDDVHQLAQRTTALLRDPPQLAQRKSHALARRRHRPWQSVGEELARLLQDVVVAPS